ncbi:LpqB family beta-propeller domain-containing protein [Tsukamurella sp. PLM1]|uniref:LpqB family beta-propeller domain-containing protein n=1 Tax=Tsukamurella sp. PLM1 TaxID=2929795 RepID=UPI0020700626|nr:LpqB family beta-propeller domain-containing protein [Tsukamurella sp. PLM1]BDH58694.1 hypothetical protein MTP03_36330 [Tsukamurella sp. PLM1]
MNTIRSIGLSGSGRQVAAVLDSGARGGPGTALMLGPYGGVPTRVLTAGSMTRPSWTPDDAGVWTVLDGTRVVRLRQDQTTGEVTTSDVDSAAVAAAAPGPITELRLSRSGVRVAMVVGGRVLVGVVQTAPDGRTTISHVQAVVTDRELVASSVDWQTGDSFVIGRNTSDSPVLLVHPDSGDVNALPSRNLSPPVSNVAATSTTVYATDSSGCGRSASGRTAAPSSGARWTAWPVVARTRSCPADNARYWTTWGSLGGRSAGSSGSGRPRRARGAAHVRRLRRAAGALVRALRGGAARRARAHPHHASRRGARLDAGPVRRCAAARGPAAQGARAG